MRGFDSETYVITGPLRNFSIRVKLFCRQSKAEEQYLEEEYVFHWQEKIFSPKEKALYRDRKNCTTETQLLYNKEISSMKGSGFPTKRLFSYVHKDEISVERDIFVDGIGSISYPEKQRSNIQLKVDDLSNHIPKNEMLLEIPPDYHRYVSHLSTRITQEMYIMADLSSDIPNDAADLSPLYVGDEEILCKITIDSNGLLRCKPDFTRGSVKYKIKSKQKGSYYFTLENISLQMSDLDKQKIRNMDKEISLRKYSHFCASIGKQFEMPNEQSFRLFIAGEIMGATNFENPGLYVQYYLELPQNWKAYDHKLLCGSSQIASIKNYGNEEIIMFSHPIEFDLTYKPEISIDLTKGSVSIWPTLYFEVQSLDFWTRSRTEGYGFTELPRTAGAHSIGVSCWRPVGDSVVEELRRFFIGGTCQLEDPTFAKIPGSFESNNLVKYGFRTKSTGKIFLHLNCAIQSWSNLYRTMSKCPTTGDEKQRRIALAHMDVSTIIKAYQKARSKLLETRKVIEGLGKLNL
uniref:Meckel syndrome type 1 protein n=1 Tax=Schistosoma mansoni TaxID=6183 RepID=A0A3Q0KFN5_SCHMA